MSHVPIERGTDRKKPVDEHQKGKLRREKEKNDWRRRNGK
jgi:hypothetical protein